MADYQKYRTNQDGFFDGAFYPKGAVLELTEVQARYSVLSGGLLPVEKRTPIKKQTDENAD